MIIDYDPCDIKKKIQEQNLQICKEIMTGSTQGTPLKDNPCRVKPVFKVKPELSFGLVSELLDLSIP